MSNFFFNKETASIVAAKANEIIEKNIEDVEVFRPITSEEMREFKNIIKAQQQVLDEIKHPEIVEVA